MRSMSLQIIVLILATLATSCKPKATIQVLSPEDFSQKLSKTKDKVLLDVRTSDEYKSGHISDALNLDIDSAGFENGIQSINKNSALFVYSTSDEQNDKAIDMLKGKGFSAIYVLKGGVLAWQDAGFPFDHWPSKNNPHDVLLTEAEYEKSIQQHKQVLVDFNATWCAPCRLQSPILEDIARQKGDSLLFLSIDVDKNMDLAKSQRIEALPTLLIYRDGKQIWKNIGYTEKNIIEGVLNGSTH